MNRCFCLLFVFHYLAAKAQPEQFPYSLYWKKEILITGAGFALQKGGTFIGNTRDYYNYDYGDAERRRIPFCDKWSVNYFSENAAKKSDVAKRSGNVMALLIVSNEFLNDLKSFDPNTPRVSRRLWQSRGIIVLTMFAETKLITSGMINISKGVVHRFRPYVYSHNHPGEESTVYSTQSFFSGHTAKTAAAAFFAAKVYSDIYPDSKWKNVIWVTAATIPAVTGALRIKAGRHFLSDVVLGYTVGAAVGLLVPHLHKNKKNEPRNVQLLPLYNKDVKGISLKYAIK